MSTLHRRQFIQQTSLLTLGGLTAASTLAQSFTTPATTVKVGIIGVGYRGQEHLKLLLQRSDVELVAIADPDLQMLAMANKIILTNVQILGCYEP